MAGLTPPPTPPSNTALQLGLYCTSLSQSEAYTLSSHRIVYIVYSLRLHLSDSVSTSFSAAVVPSALSSHTFGAHSPCNGDRAIGARFLCSGHAFGVLCWRYTPPPAKISDPPCCYLKKTQGGSTFYVPMHCTVVDFNSRNFDPLP